MASETTVSGAIAERYATALYDLADEQKALDTAAEDLRQIKEMIADSADLKRLIRSPLIRRENQRDAITAVLEAAQVATLTRNFVGVVANNRRLFALPTIIEEFLRILATRRGEVTAEVTSATALSDGQVTAITEALRRKVGAKVAVDLKVDPGIIGGLIIRVGSRMVDNSLRTKLQKLQLAMKGTG